MERKSKREREFEKWKIKFPQTHWRDRVYKKIKSAKRTKTQTVTIPALNSQIEGNTATTG